MEHGDDFSTSDDDDDDTNNEIDMSNAGQDGHETSDEDSPTMVRGNLAQLRPQTTKVSLAHFHIINKADNTYSRLRLFVRLIGRANGTMGVLAKPIRSCIV